MTSTFSPASASPGNCVVCGKETWTRCSACSENGLEWMCFCSIEHQKAIWFMHKRVCGIRAVPFQWPPLTPFEINDVLSMSKKPFKLNGASSPSNFAETLSNDQDSDYKRDQQFPDVVLANFIGSLEDPGSDQSISLELSKRTFQVRALSHLARVHTAHFTNPQTPKEYFSYNAVHQAPWDGMASKLKCVIGNLARDPQATPWYTQHLHLYLIHYAILSLCSTLRGNTLDNPQHYVKYTSRQLEKFYIEVVAKTHPREAYLLINELILNKYPAALRPS